MPELIWIGELFRGFHSAPNAMLVNGIEDVWLVKRPGYNNIQPPLRSVEVPVDVIDNIESVFFVGRDGEVYCKFKPVRFYDIAKREFTILSDESIGIEGDASLSPDGMLLAVNDHPFQFSMLDNTGKMLVTGYSLRDNNPGHLFEGSSVPFWQIGADSVSAGKSFFTVSGPSLGRLDIFSYSGRIINSLESVNFNGHKINVGNARSLVDRRGHIWATDGLVMVNISVDGDVLFAIRYDELSKGPFYPSFDTWFGIDSCDNLWCTNGTGVFAGFKILS